MNTVTVSELAALPDATVIDVREPSEFSAGHVPGATPIPLGQLGERLAEITGEGPVYLICQSGGRSAKATEFLASRGVNAVNVEGGTSAWQQAGHPTTTT
jgi:rhodanese-related sulfurtransferase